MSKLADSVHRILKQIFPYFTITKEYYINYKNTRLFFDFHVRELNLFFEVQGDQHLEYNEHFHGDRNGFLASRARDNLKKEWIEKKEVHLIEVFSKDKVNKFLLLKKIYNEIGYEFPTKRKKRRKRKPKHHGHDNYKRRNDRKDQKGKRL